MAGLLRPVSTKHHVTQGFNGHDFREAPGFLSIDGVGPRRARRRAFPNSLGFTNLHGAIDFSCPLGTKIIAPEAGRIVDIGTYKETGENYLMLQIRPGTILFFTHLRSPSVAKHVDVVRGQEIARSGDSGKGSGPHLHWEVRITTRQDPDPSRSSRWFKWNPRRLRVGRDLANLRAIIPLVGPPVPAELVIETDPDPDPLLDVDPGPDEPDTFGDTAALAGDGTPLVDVSPEELDLDPEDDLEP